MSLVKKLLQTTNKFREIFEEITDCFRCEEDIEPEPIERHMRRI